MRLAGALGGAGPLLQILSQHVLVTIQNFEAFLILQPTDLRADVSYQGSVHAFAFHRLSRLYAALLRSGSSGY